MILSIVGKAVEVTKSGPVRVKADITLNKDELKKNIYFMMLRNPWLWDYLEKIRDKLDDKGVE